ncbi:MAG: cobyrinate a,c-diamide synthase [Desulfobacterales bacterium]|nr:MAG: cobyrinate a,c-diamide synthase [Desulfobacterales bacterium]
MEFPRIIIAALRGGSGKTILSVAIIAALSNQGKRIAPFKKGPDYIDAGWLALAAGHSCYNLDSFLLSPEANLTSFLLHATDSDLSVIEGNRGLYDGIDLEGSTSTAELAKLLQCPVVLCVDCTKMTRTMAAVVLGCTQFDPDVMIKGVILNRVANARHEKKLRESVAHYCGVPVLGAIPRLSEQHFPERHLGLVPTAEHHWAEDSIAAIMKIGESHLDLATIAEIAQNAPVLEMEDRGRRSEVRRQIIEGSGPAFPSGVMARHTEKAVSWRPGTTNHEPETNDQKPATSIQHPVSSIENPSPRIGIIRDSAFQFYYPENIEALSEGGAEILFISPLTDQELPELDALYIGGGFPETHARQLASNKKFNAQLKALADEGFPIYAECGGLMYLGKSLVLEGHSHPMVGILPVTFDFYKRPQGHGYTVVQVVAENPYYDVGSEIRGHEFHYSRVSKLEGEKCDLVFRMQRGEGIEKDRDGIVYKKVLATYTHVHALGTPQWARALVRNAIQFKKNRI